ncbi:MAG: hypothetical protein JWO37_1793 [Acidimicrobiales bacterium]|jgi:hypothetical protein|nr:hypothetical protein [Acidimicrobiales bacterium]
MEEHETAGIAAVVIGRGHTRTLVATGIRSFRQLGEEGGTASAWFSHRGDEFLNRSGDVPETRDRLSMDLWQTMSITRPWLWSTPSPLRVKA